MSPITDPGGHAGGLSLSSPNASSEHVCRPLATPGEITTPSGRMMSVPVPVDCAIGSSSDGKLMPIWKPVAVSVAELCGVMSSVGVKGTLPHPVGVKPAPEADVLVPPQETPSARIGAGMQAEGIVMKALPPTMPENVSFMWVIVMFWLSGPMPTVRGRSARKLSMPKSLLTPCCVRRKLGRLRVGRARDAGEVRDVDAQAGGLTALGHEVVDLTGRGRGDRKRRVDHRVDAGGAHLARGRAGVRVELRLRARGRRARVAQQARREMHREVAQVIVARERDVDVDVRVAAGLGRAGTARVRVLRRQRDARDAERLRTAGRCEQHRDGDEHEQQSAPGARVGSQPFPRPPESLCVHVRVRLC